jgi:hypothetical protein
MTAKKAPPKKVTLNLTEEDKQRLESLARKFGYTQTRGAGVGRVGSISKLMHAIAQGKIDLSPTLPSRTVQE